MCYWQLTRGFLVATGCRLQQACSMMGFYCRFSSRLLTTALGVHPLDVILKRLASNSVRAVTPWLTVWLGNYRPEPGDWFMEVTSPAIPIFIFSLPIQIEYRTLYFACLFIYSASSFQWKTQDTRPYYHHRRKLPQFAPETRWSYGEYYAWQRHEYPEVNCN